MRAQIHNLAQLMKAKLLQGQRFVLMLGAGASLSSGVPPTRRIMEELVERYGSDLAGDPEDRFDELWRRSSEDDRRLFLEPHLAKTPSPGYGRLASLIREGYFDLVITFNFDALLEKALKAAGFTDFKVVLRGETEIDKIARLVERPQAALTLLKLHGSLFSTDTFLFDKEEMLNYPPEIEGLLQRLTRRDIIVCGYAFNDLCVLKAFSPEGNSVFCVSPSGIPSPLKGIMINRRSKDRGIAGELGKFDNFFDELCREVQQEAPAAGADGRRRCNPFKFLDSYAARDREWFFGRRQLVASTLERLHTTRPPVLHFTGSRKVGKTSFIRAGLIANLDPERYEPIYLRCRSDLEAQLAEHLGPRLGLGPGAAGHAPLATLLARLEETAGKHVLLILDQFENVLKVGDDEKAQRVLISLLETLCGRRSGKLTVILVAVDEKDYYKLLLGLNLEQEARKVEEIKPLPPPKVRAILRLLALKGGLRLDRRVLDRLVGAYKDRRDSKSPVTLAHLQALCYLAARQSALDWEKFNKLISHEVEAALDLAINECDVMNFVEDLPIREERALLRNLMKIVSEPSKRLIATFLRDRFSELAGAEPYPEPL